MLQSDELPLAEVLDADQWQAVFCGHEVDFGSDEDAIYTPAITLWALISHFRYSFFCKSLELTNADRIATVVQILPIAKPKPVLFGPTK